MKNYVEGKGGILSGKGKEENKKRLNTIFPWRNNFDKNLFNMIKE
jgi:hypothetical protein